MRASLPLLQNGYATHANSAIGNGHMGRDSPGRWSQDPSFHRRGAGSHWGVLSQHQVIYQRRAAQRASSASSQLACASCAPPPAPSARPAVVRPCAHTPLPMLQSASSPPPPACSPTIPPAAAATDPASRPASGAAPPWAPPAARSTPDRQLAQRTARRTPAPAARRVAPAARRTCRPPACVRQPPCPASTSFACFYDTTCSGQHHHPQRATPQPRFCNTPSHHRPYTRTDPPPLPTRLPVPRGNLARLQLSFPSLHAQRRAAPAPVARPSACSPAAVTHACMPTTYDALALVEPPQRPRRRRRRRRRRPLPPPPPPPPTRNPRHTTPPFSTASPALSPVPCPLTACLVRPLCPVLPCSLPPPPSLYQLLFRPNLACATFPPTP